MSGGQHEKVTVFACCSATGNSLPPMLIFKCQSGRVPNSTQEGAPAGTLFAGQKFSRINKDLFFKWFKELFLKSVLPKHPILLLVNGHKAHVMAKLIRWKQQIKFWFPASLHSFHLLHP